MVPISIVMAAGDIPDNSIVTKRTGQKEYIIKNKIRIFADQNSGTQAQTLESDGVRYLTVGNGDINAISAKLELIWRTTTGELYEFLKEMIDPEEDK
jgi:hypothetical protein